MDEQLGKALIALVMILGLLLIVAGAIFGGLGTLLG